MKSIWKAVKSAVKQQVPGHSYRMWIEPLEHQPGDVEQLVLTCPNLFSKKWVQDHYGALIATELERVSGRPCSYRLMVGDLKTASPHLPEKYPQKPLLPVNTRPHNGRLLRRDFTFDQFVVGGNNDFAYSASLSLASKKNAAQQSLLLLSKTGLGKSHLSQAVGHYVLSACPSERVYYMTAEDFANEMIAAFRCNDIDKFKKKYRTQCDVLLLEDIHYLSGKERTQIELAHILDALYESQKKLIFTSCYIPADIPKLTDTLRSRLSCGLISNIEPPGYKTRVKILNQKSMACGSKVPLEVIDFLAAELTEDVRQLESGLIGVTAKSSLMGIPIELNLAESVVKNIIRQRKTITVETIKKMVCREFQISMNDIVSRSRRQAVVRPRQIAIYLARKYTDSPLQVIGRSFNRYHATALYSINAVEREVKSNAALQKQLQMLSEKLENGSY